MIKKVFRRDIIAQFLVLFALWMLLSGKTDVLHVSLGLFSTSLVVLVHFRLNQHLYFHRKYVREHPLRIRRLFFFIPWMTWEIIQASLQVAYVVLHPKMPINPSLIKFKSRLPNVAAKVILGNSITLTPGTLTISIDGDEFLVHALTEASLSSIVDGSLPEQVAKLYQRSPAAVVENLSIHKTTRNI